MFGMVWCGSLAWFNGRVVLTSSLSSSLLSPSWSSLSSSHRSSVSKPPSAMLHIIIRNILGYTYKYTEDLWLDDKLDNDGDNDDDKEEVNTVKRITFDRTVAKPGESLYVSVPKLNQHEIIVPGSLFLVFDIDLSGGHANNFVVQNVSRALVDRLVVKFAGTTIQDTVGYDIYKIFEDLFLSEKARQNMHREGIQSIDLCIIRSNSGDKKSSGVDTENKLAGAYKNKYRIHLDHQILTDHGVFYTQALLQQSYFRSNSRPRNTGREGLTESLLSWFTS